MLSYRRVCGGARADVSTNENMSEDEIFFPPFFSLLFIMHTRVCVSRHG